MKYILLALALTLAVASCSKYEVYERNLVYMTDPVFAAEKTRVSDLVAQRQRELTQAEASGDSGRIKNARAAFTEAQGQYRGVESEARRRQRTW